MNPARSLAPALLSGVWTDYGYRLAATFMGTSLIALFVEKSLNK